MNLFLDVNRILQHPREGPVVTAYIEINPELCKDCQLCISVCPNQLISPSDQLNPKGYRPVQFVEKQAKKEERKCKGCCLCAISCPEIAIEVYRG
jgi:2-oxoglutarate ferredoxin oxidoreductase subunit delta